MTGTTRNLLLLGLLALMFWYRGALVTALLPFFLAIIGASLLEPPVRWLNRRARIPRGIAVFGVLSATVLAGGTFLGFIIAVAISQVMDALNQLPRYRQILTPTLAALVERVAQLLGRVPPEVLDLAKANIERIVLTGEALATKVLTALINAAVAVPTALVVVLIALLATYFLAKDREVFLTFIGGLLPEQHRHRLREVQGLIINDTFRYIRAQLWLITQTTLVTTLGLWLLGVRNWLAVGLVSGALDLLPALGPGLLFVPWIGYAVLTGAPKFALALAVIYGGVTLVRQLMEARVIGSSIGVHPLITLFALYASVVFFGARGILLAPVLVIVGKALITAGVIRLPRSPK